MDPLCIVYCVLTVLLVLSIFLYRRPCAMEFPQHAQLPMFLPRFQLQVERESEDLSNVASMINALASRQDGTTGYQQ